jgi:hypothetical protein
MYHHGCWYQKNPINIPSGWWFGIWILFSHHFRNGKYGKSSWRTHSMIFQRGRSTINQPWLSPKNPKKNPLICHPADGWVVGDVQP